MYCPKCGTNNEDNNSFCKSCGNILKAAAAVESAPAGIANTVNSTVSKKTKRFPAAAIVVLALAFAAVCIAGAYTLVKMGSNSLAVDGPVNTRGNTIGNIANGGFVAQQGKWIYYRNTTIDCKLYKIKTDDTGETLLNDDKSKYINVIGEWVYYVNESDGGKIYRIKTDGKDRTRLNTDKSNALNVLDGWIYYVNQTDNKKLYRITTDGKNRTKINDSKSAYPIVMNGWIYYINESKDKEVSKVKTDGSGGMILCGKGGASCLNLSGGTLYFNNDWGSLFRVGTDGSSYKMLSDGGIGGVYTKYYKTIHTLNIDNGTIYFSNMKSLSMDLGMMDFKAQSWTKLYNQEWVTGINLAGNRIYFTDQPGKLYRIQKDGKGFAAVE